MPRFLFVAKTWVNVDTINYVEVRPGNANPAEPRCVIHFQGGRGPLEFEDAAAKQLLETIAKHRAE